MGICSSAICSARPGPSSCSSPATSARTSRTSAPSTPGQRARSISRRWSPGRTPCGSPGATTPAGSRHAAPVSPVRSPSAPWAPSRTCRRSGTSATSPSARPARSWSRIKIRPANEGPSNIFTHTDADGLGAGAFGGPVTVTTTNVGGFDFLPAQPQRSVDAEAGLAWDRTGGANDDRVYLIYNDENPAESNDFDVFVRTSDDDGANWSAPTQINDDAGTNSPDAAEDRARPGER